jgi:hypothetical protein
MKFVATDLVECVKSIYRNEIEMGHLYLLMIDTNLEGLDPVDDEDWYHFRRVLRAAIEELNEDEIGVREVVCDLYESVEIEFIQELDKLELPPLLAEAKDVT